MSDLLKDKNIVIMGLRNKWSIAYGIAEEARAQGANLIFTCLGERERSDIERTLSDIGEFPIYECDISSDEQIDKVFDEIKEKFGVIHGVVHAIAHAKAEDIKNDFIYTSRDGFAHAMDVSVYSLIAVSRKARELMTEGGSIVTLTYMGSEKVFRGYNVMAIAKSALESSVRYLASDLGESNIRVNAVSAGPIKTMSARGIKDFSSIVDVTKDRAPLKRNVTKEEVGKTVVYYLSDLASGVTGEVTHVDSGFNIMGM